MCSVGDGRGLGWVWFGVTMDAKRGLQKLSQKFEGRRKGCKLSGSVEGHDNVNGLS